MISSRRLIDARSSEVFMVNNKIPVERGLTGFQNYTINSINKQWDSFDSMPFILAYFLHPGYRDK